MKTKKIILGSFLALVSMGHSQLLQVTSGVANQSGLKFTNLTSSSPLLTNPGSGVLGLSATGDVILVPAGVGGGLLGANNGLSVSGGNAVLGGLYGSAASAQLLSNRQIPQNNNGIFFSGNQTNDVFQLGGQFISNSARLVVEQSASGSGSPTWSKGISCFSNVDATTYNNSLYCLAQDKSPSLFAPMNMGAYIESTGRGIQKGARIVTSRTSGATGSTYGIDILTSDGFGTGAVYGANIAATGGNGNVYGVRSTADGAVQSIGGYFGSNNATGPNSILSIGVQGFAGNNPVENMGANNSATGGIFPNSTTYGTWSGAGGGAVNYGVKSNGQGNNSINYGVHGYADGGNSHNYGVYGEAGPSGVGSTNFGVYGTASGNGTNWAGYFVGDVTVNGAGVITNGPWSPSDKRIKKEVKDLKSAMEILQKIKPKTYFYDKSNYKALNIEDDRLQYGVIAQELEEVLPELVRETSILTAYTNNDKTKPEMTKFKSVNYIELVPILVAGMNEQQQQINELKALVQSLASSSTNKTTGMNSTAVSLSDKNVLVLDQNVPNPFAESTVITYNIPNDFSKAQIIFTTNDGKAIKVINITEKGAGSLTVFANDLTNGAYSYSLIIDGKTIDSKKMIKE